MQVYNSEFAYRQLAGNTDLLNRLLTKFIGNYQHADTQLMTMLQNQSFDDARLLVHTIKGAAGNLGMEMLLATASEVEQFCRTKTLTKAHIEQLQAQIEAVHQEVTSLQD